MESYLTPGVHIELVLTEPKRVLRTGVPVFLGLIRRQDLKVYNDLQKDEDEKFITKAIRGYPNARIARKRGYVRLPERPASDDAVPASSSLYLRAAVGSGKPDPRVSEEVRAYAGAGGQPKTPSTESADDEEAIPSQAISNKPQRFTVWPQFDATYGGLSPFGFLTYAVRGFFENGGRLCYVQLIACEEDETFEGDEVFEAVQAGLHTLEVSREYDLLCVPDIMWMYRDGDGVTTDEAAVAQSAVIEHCQRLGDCFALLDTTPSGDSETVIDHRRQLTGDAAALYYPWLHVAEGPTATNGSVPPCGHVAGVYARSDLRIGVHKAPANEVLQGVRHLGVDLTEEQQGPLNEQSINCIRAFPRRGIRIWGARTLSSSPTWRYVNVRRIFITAARWIERNMVHVVFEPNTPELWAHIVRDLTAYFTELVERGALTGTGSGSAFYVKCDAETNPPELRETGQVVTEIGLAPSAPAEFIVVRIMHGQTGVRIIGPT